MKYRVHHRTRYEYDSAVSQCQSEVRLTPRALPWQRLVASEVVTAPVATWRSNRLDYFGNEVTTFTILETHDRFTTTATSIVDVEAPPASPSGLSWEGARDLLAAHEGPDLLAAFEFTFASPYVPTASALAAYGRASFTPGRALTEAVEDLSHRVHRDFEYKPRATTVDTPLLETLKAKKGVCQDFAQVTIGTLRSLGLAARYVSGYLRSGANVQGAEASHAWVSVFVPGAGWFDIDPTNDVRPGTGHVTVAWGRDYGDVAPVKGVALGGGNQVVDVAVRVEPVDTVTVD